jgi:hypothetical protein
MMSDIDTPPVIIVSSASDDHVYVWSLYSLPSTRLSCAWRSFALGVSRLDQRRDRL